MKPGEFYFTKSHEWIRYLDEFTAEIGISAFAIRSLGDIVYVGLPQEGEFLHASQPFADIESVKAVSDIYAPVSGTVSACNEELIEHPEILNEVPYETWLVKVCNITEQKELMTQEEYQDYLLELKK